MQHANARLAVWPLFATGVLLPLLGGCSLPAPHPLQRLQLPQSPVRVPLAEAPLHAGTAESDGNACLTRIGTEGARELAPDASLDDYRLFAALNNPGLRALFERWRAQTERVPQVRSLPEPRLTYTEFVESIETRTGPQERSFGLRQEFPWFGKLRLRGSIAEEKAAAAWNRFIGAQLALDHRVRTTYADYFFLGRSIAVTRENLELLLRLERVARERFAAGAENHTDVIRLQVEMGGLEDRLETLLDKRRPVQAQLNALLNRSIETEIAWPTELPEDSFHVDDVEVARRLKEHNPELLALHHEIEGAELARSLAAKEYFPDFALGVQTIATGSAVASGTRGSGDDPWLLSLSIELPLWFSKYRAGARQAQANWRAARDERQNARNRLAADVELVLYQLRDARRRIDLYGGGLVRKAEEALASTEASFQADRSDFSDWIDVERVLLDYQLARERARADRFRAEADLDRYLGRYLGSYVGPLSKAEADE